MNNKFIKTVKQKLFKILISIKRMQLLQVIILMKN